MTKEFKGYSLFNDIEDKELRNRNRAVILANITEDNIDRKTKRVNSKGSMLVIGYFASIPEEDQAEVKTKYREAMNQRGYGLVEKADERNEV